MPKNLYSKKKPSTSRENTNSAIDTSHEGEEEQQENQPIDLQQEEHVPFLASTPPRPLALSDLPLDVIVPNPFQARQIFNPERLRELADSMRTHGIISRIRVRKAPSSSQDEERYELAYGERRWRAARLANITHYPVEIVAYSDDEMVEIGLLENVQREDLAPLEEAQMYQRLLQQLDEFGQPRYSIRKLAERIGKDKSYIEIRLAVLRSPDDVQQLVEDHPEVPLRTAYEIGKVEDVEKREEIITDIVEGKLGKVEDVKTRVREATGRTQERPNLVLVQSSGSASPTQGERSVDDDVQITSVPPSLQDDESASPTVSAETPNTSANLVTTFEEQLQKDNGMIMEVVYRLNASIEAMTPVQRELLISHIDSWGKSFMEMKSHARSHTTHP